MKTISELSARFHHAGCVINTSLSACARIRRVVRGPRDGCSTVKANGADVPPWRPVFHLFVFSYEFIRGFVCHSSTAVSVTGNSCQSRTMLKLPHGQYYSGIRKPKSRGRISRHHLSGSRAKEKEKVCEKER